jgi:hypothetical protein
MHLDAEQSAWLQQAAEQSGPGYDELMLKLLDDARARTEVGSDRVGIAPGG